MFASEKRQREVRDSRFSFLEDSGKGLDVDVLYVCSVCLWRIVRIDQSVEFVAELSAVRRKTFFHEYLQYFRSYRL